MCVRGVVFGLVCLWCVLCCLCAFVFFVPLWEFRCACVSLGVGGVSV